ncbi:MAG: VOC family protein [Bacteroidota bacterium]
MKQELAHIAILVNDYDEAISFYTEKLKFTLVEDTRLSTEKRWVLVRPPGANGCCLLLAKAVNDEQKRFVGNQSGGRVFLFLYTDDIERDYLNLISRNIKIVREPITETWGKVCVFEDIYGNHWDLIERTGQ